MGVTSLWGRPSLPVLSIWGSVLVPSRIPAHSPQPTLFLGFPQALRKLFCFPLSVGKPEWSSRAGEPAQGNLSPSPLRSPSIQLLVPIAFNLSVTGFCNNSSAGLKSWEVAFCHFMSVKSGQGSSELNFHHSLKIPTSLRRGRGSEPPRCCCQLNVGRSKN